ncbi:hypothetical protein K3495_g2031 [Podosphaera aphanis]|nr:hypothetical protein K3495_g2031 [Podosphaera aphanis]
MLLVSRTAAHRPVQRHLNSVGVWIFDDDSTMDAYYIVSTVSKIGKRHGSSCPGPLEHQRRLGKRKMAYELHRFPTPEQSLWSWLSSFREVDYTKWKWEPPRSVDMAPKPCTETARYNWSEWLFSSCSSIKKIANPISFLKFEDQNSFSIQERESALRDSINHGSISKIKDSSQRFNQALRKCLIEGTIHEKEIVKLLHGLIEDFQTKILDPHLAYSLCYSLLNITWEGLTDKNTRTFTSTNSLTSLEILRGLSNLVSTFEVQSLIAAIIQSIPRWDDTTLHRETFQLILQSWTSSWSRDAICMDNCSEVEMASQRLLIATEDIVLKVQHMISEVEKIIFAGNSKALSSYIHELEYQIHLSLNAIKITENFVVPAKLSALNLTKILSYLPTDLLTVLLHDCSRQICEKLQNHVKGYEDVEKYWLLSISQLSKLHESDFLSLLKYIDAHSKSLCLYIYPELLINRWACKKGVENLELIRNIMRVSSFGNQKFTPWICLIDAIYQFFPKKSHFKKIDNIFRLLEELGEFEAIGQVMLGMKDINPRLPVEIVEFVVETVSNYNPEMAWKIVLLSRIMKPGRKYKSKRFPHGDYRTIRYSNCTTFVMWMINDSKINHKYMWRILGIPMHAKYTPRYRNQPSSKPLHPSLIKLYREMATAFAYSKRLSSRAAFRCVMQCWHHLSHHKTPLDSTLTKALVYSGLARCIENKLWVPRERLYWLLSLIKQAEGREIADQVEKAVTEWNEAIAFKQARIMRESNVLNVGLID